MSILLRDSRVWSHLVVLSVVSLSGMIMLMAIIFWQMQDNIMSERRHLLRAQVTSAIAITENIYQQSETGAISESEAKQKVLNYISVMRYPDNGYFWVQKDDSEMLMHPFSQELIGRMTMDLLDSSGKYFVREFITTAKTGGGFVNYEWSRPNQDEPIPKVAYVTLFMPWNWVIGSGLYIDDLNESARRQISLGAVLIFILFGINIAISLFLSRRYMKEYRETAIHDSLTGLYTRRYLDEVGTRILNRSENEGGSGLGAIFFDIDHFKKINDLYGHKTGDNVLRFVGEILRNRLRPNEMAFRYGGEEFVLLISTSEAACRDIAERIRASVNQHTFETPNGNFNVTVSAGISVAQGHESIHEILRRADKCMYVAKSKGRNCTVVESQLD
ncbi:MAG: cache domain-containing protein [Candidatus Thiodiazotropha taylori]